MPNLGPGVAAAPDPAVGQDVTCPDTWWRVSGAAARGPGRGPGVSGLAEAAVDVVGGAGVVRLVEHLLRRARLHDVPGRVLGGEEEGAIARYALRLLHVVGHDHDRD